MSLEGCSHNIAHPPHDYKIISKLFKFYPLSELALFIVVVLFRHKRWKHQRLSFTKRIQHSHPYQYSKLSFLYLPFGWNNFSKNAPSQEWKWQNSTHNFVQRYSYHFNFYFVTHKHLLCPFHLVWLYLLLSILW